MKTNPLSTGTLTENLNGIGVVTRAMIHERALKLALIAGYRPPHVRQSDYEQAKRELTANSDTGSRETAVDSMPESMHWNPIPGSEGIQVPEAPSEDEDDEGRSETEQLVDQGAQEADQDTMYQAARAHEKALHADARRP